jgi:hypothetical protein
MSWYSVGRKNNQRALHKLHECNKEGAIIRNVRIWKVERYADTMNTYRKRDESKRELTITHKTKYVRE